MLQKDKSKGTVASTYRPITCLPLMWKLLTINHLLFMDDLKLHSRSEKGLDSLVQTVCVFSEDIGMEFGIKKCAMLVMEKGKIVKSVDIEWPDGKVIKSLQEGDSYKYLGILEQISF